MWRFFLLLCFTFLPLVVLTIYSIFKGSGCLIITTISCPPSTILGLFGSVSFPMSELLSLGYTSWVWEIMIGTKEDFLVEGGRGKAAVADEWRSRGRLS